MSSLKFTGETAGRAAALVGETGRNLKHRETSETLQNVAGIRDPSSRWPHPLPADEFSESAEVAPMVRPRNVACSVAGA
jgi:hypothetical protein